MINFFSMNKKLIQISFILLLFSVAGKAEKITFPSIDGVIITADLYMIHPDTVPMILLFHQAGWSRGEYLQIAPQLNRMGYNCLAVDLRSGKEVNNIPNETYSDAKKKMKETHYLAAEKDVIAAIEYAEKAFHGDLILWGSSYSASLVLIAGSEWQDKIKAILSFSPGEYFTTLGKPKDFIAQYAARIRIPVFVACSGIEAERVNAIFEKIPSEDKILFIPDTSGYHGSSALWDSQFDSKYYWKAVEDFMKSLNLS
jgi:dienelactone hydrolase